MADAKEPETIEERIEEEQEEIKQLVEETMELAEENKHLVEETKELTEQNNKILRSIRRLGMIELVMRVMWFAILLGLPVAIYYYLLAPYLQFFGATQGQTLPDLGRLPGSEFLSRILGQ